MDTFKLHFYGGAGGRGQFVEVEEGRLAWGSDPEARGVGGRSAGSGASGPTTATLATPVWASASSAAREARAPTLPTPGALWGEVAGAREGLGIPRPDGPS